VKRQVELAVTAAVEAVAAHVARGGGDRRNAAHAGKLCVAFEALGTGEIADRLRPAPALAPEESYRNCTPP
jgi:hypothetical protein